MSLRLTKLVSDLALSNLRDPRLPFKLTMILTYWCQLRCNMCNIWQRRPEGELETEELLEFFRRNRNFSWINLSGGEIFLRPDIEDVLEGVIRESPRLYLLDFPTNGFQTRRIVDCVRNLLRRPPPKLLITVSLDGPRETHDEIRGVEGSFDHALQTFRELRKLRNRRFQPFLGMTLQPMNVDRVDAALAEVRQEIPDFEPKELHVNMVHESGHYYDNVGTPIPSAEETLRAMQHVRSLRGRSSHPVAFLEARYQKLAERFLNTGKTPLPCHALSSSVFIDSFGNVLPCSIYDHPLGNLREIDFRLSNLWDDPKVTDLAKEIRGGACPQCWTPCEAYQTILANLLPRRRESLPDPETRRN